MLGTFDADIKIVDDTHFSCNGKKITVVSNRDPTQLPWKEMKIDLVIEGTGVFLNTEGAGKHIEAGAKKVLITAPAKGDDIPTYVVGVNEKDLDMNAKIVSNASCTTNCLAPVVEALHKTVGIESGLMTTIHSYTNDQKLSDVYHTDLYRARSATQSMIPTKTGAAAAIGKVIPDLNGKLDGLAVRVPTINVSLVDFGFIAGRDTTVEEINEAVKAAAENNPVLGYNVEKLVSVDFNHNALSSVFDANHTRVIGRHVKVMAWYDNEWGFSNRMLDNAIALMNASK